VNAGYYHAADNLIREVFGHQVFLKQRASPLPKVLYIAADRRRINRQRISERSPNAVALPFQMDSILPEQLIGACHVHDGVVHDNDDGLPPVCIPRRMS
jgi:hypothetical protein